MDQRSGLASAEGNSGSGLNWMCIIIDCCLPFFSNIKQSCLCSPEICWELHSSSFSFIVLFCFFAGLYLITIYFPYEFYVRGLMFSHVWLIQPAAILSLKHWLKILVQLNCNISTQATLITMPAHGAEEIGGPQHGSFTAHDLHHSYKCNSMHAYLAANLIKHTGIYFVRYISK